jgi:hypothetical protein
VLLIDLKRAGCALALALSLLAPGLAHAEEEDGKVIAISREGKLFNITLTEAQPVEDVLDELAGALGAVVEGGEDSGDVGPLKLVRVSLHQALREILQKQSFSMKFTEGSADPALIRIAARKVAAVDNPPADGGEQPAAPQGKQLLLDLLRGKQAGAKQQGGGLEGLLGSNNALQALKVCGDLLKLPENRGKKSETLVTPEGKACPPGIKVFGQ